MLDSEVSTAGFILVSPINPNMQINCFKTSNLFPFKKITTTKKPQSKTQANKLEYNVWA